MESKVDLILHPVRIRIIAILFGREMTTHEVAKAMPDVPPATLYRHLRLLVRSSIVSVVAEKRVRGATERVYRVAPAQAAITPEEVRNLDPEDHRRMFMSFIATVIGGFERYLVQGRIDLLADGVTYAQATMFLDDDELRRFGVEVAAVFQRAVALPPRTGRRRRTVSTIVIPEPVEGPGIRPASGKENELA